MTKPSEIIYSRNENRTSTSLEWLRTLVRRTMPKIADSANSLTLIFNPLWEALADFLASECEKCGQARLLSLSLTRTHVGASCVEVAY